MALDFAQFKETYVEPKEKPVGQFVTGADFSFAEEPSTYHQTADGTLEPMIAMPTQPKRIEIDDRSWWQKTTDFVSDIQDITKSLQEEAFWTAPRLFWTEVRRIFEPEEESKIEQEKHWLLEAWDNFEDVSMLYFHPTEMIMKAWNLIPEYEVKHRIEEVINDVLQVPISEYAISAISELDERRKIMAERIYDEDPRTSWKELTYAWGLTSVSYAEAITVGIATGSPIVAAGTLSMIEAADEYNEARKMGLSPDEAMKTADRSMKITFLLESIGMEYLWAISGGLWLSHTWLAKNMFVRGGVMAAVETTEELSQMLWQNLNRKYTYKPAQKITEGWWETIVAVSLPSFILGVIAPMLPLGKRPAAPPVSPEVINNFKQQTAAQLETAYSKDAAQIVKNTDISGETSIDSVAQTMKSALAEAGLLNETGVESTINNWKNTSKMIAESERAKKAKAKVVKVAPEVKAEQMTVYRGEGGELDVMKGKISKMLPGEQYALGEGFYVETTEAAAKKFGEVTKYTIDLKEGEILRIETKQQHQDLVSAAIKMFPDLNTDQSIPKYVKSLGFKAVSISPTVDPLGGMNIIDEAIIKQIKEPKKVEVKKPVVEEFNLEEETAKMDAEKDRLKRLVVMDISKRGDLTIAQAEQAYEEMLKIAEMAKADFIANYMEGQATLGMATPIEGEAIPGKSIGELTLPEINEIATAAVPDVITDTGTIRHRMVAELMKKKVGLTDAQATAREMANAVRDAITATMGNEAMKRAAGQTALRNTLRGKRAGEIELGPIKAEFMARREMLEFPKPEEERRRRVAPVAPRTPIAALKARMKAVARGVREGRVLTKRQIKQVQTELIDLLKKSDLSLKDKAKFIAAIKNIQTAEQLEKRLPEIEARIARLEQAAVKRDLLSKISKALKRTTPKKQAGKPVGKFTPEIQKNLDMFRNAIKLTKEQADLVIQDNLARYKDSIPPYDVALENKILSLVGGIKDKTNAELREASAIIIELTEQGRLANALKKFNKDTEIQQWRDRAIDIFKGVVREEVKPEILAVGEKVEPYRKGEYLTGEAMVKKARQTGKITHETPIKNIPNILKANKIKEPFFGYEGYRSEPDFINKDVAALIHIKVPVHLKEHIHEGMRSDEIAFPADVSVRWIEKIVEAQTGNIIYSRDEEGFLRKIKPIVGKVAPVKSVPIGITTIETIEKEDSNFRHFFDTLGKDFVGMYDIMDMLSFNIKEKETFLHEFGETLDQENTNKRGDRKYQEKLRTMFIDSYGLKSDRDMLRKMRDDTVERSLGVFKNTQGEMQDLVFTKAEARKIWMEMQDPTLKDTFVKGMYYTQEMMDVVDNSLSKEDKDFIQKQFDFYREYYDTINPVYSDIYGVNLPRNPIYSPLKRMDISRDLSVGFGEFGQEIVIRGFITKGSLKSRVKNIKEIERRSDVQVLQYHIAEMEHFKAWSKKVRDLNSVFGDSQVRRTVVDEFKNGKGLLSVLDGFIKDFTRGGVETSQNMNWLDRFRGNFTRGVLMVKPSIAIKQLGSWLAFADDISVTDFAKGEYDFWKKPVSHTRTLLTSDLMKSRGQYQERDIKTAMRSEAYRAYRRKPSFLNSMMLNIRLGDKAAIIVGGWSVYKVNYDAAIKQGLSAAEARKIGIRKFELTAKKAQQSADLADLSRWQRGNSAFKLFSMFRSTPNQYFRKELGAVRNLAGKRITKKQFIKSIAIYHFILPMLFQFISDFGRWDKEEQLRAAITGPFNGWFIVGDGLEWITRKALGMRAYDMQIPIMSIWNDVGKIFSIELDDIQTEDVLRAVEGLFDATGKATGIPSGYVYEVFKGIGKMFSGEWAQALGMLAGWSEYAVTKGKKKIKVPSGAAPGIKMPTIKMPTIKMPTIKMP